MNGKKIGYLVVPAAATLIGSTTLIADAQEVKPACDSDGFQVSEESLGEAYILEQDVTRLESVYGSNRIDFVEYAERNLDAALTTYQTFECIAQALGFSAESFYHAVIQNGLRIFPHSLSPNSAEYPPVIGEYFDRQNRMHVYDSNADGTIFNVDRYGFSHEYGHWVFNNWNPLVNVDYWDESISVNQAILVEVINFAYQDYSDIPPHLRPFYFDMRHILFSGIPTQNLTNPSQGSVYTELLVPFIQENGFDFDFTDKRKIYEATRYNFIYDYYGEYMYIFSEIFAEIITQIALVNPVMPDSIIQLLSRQRLFTRYFPNSETSNVRNKQSFVQAILNKIENRKSKARRSKARAERDWSKSLNTEG